MKFADRIALFSKRNQRHGFRYLSRIFQKAPLLARSPRNPSSSLSSMLKLSISTDGRRGGAVCGDAGGRLLEAVPRDVPGGFVCAANAAQSSPMNGYFDTLLRSDNPSAQGQQPSDTMAAFASRPLAFNPAGRHQRRRCDDAKHRQRPMPPDQPRRNLLEPRRSIQACERA
jgi:hypothetical protein